MNIMQSPNTGVGKRIGDLDHKGGPGEECSRSACANSPAIGYNRSTGTWYCSQCSISLNDENRDDAKRLYGGDLVVIP